MLHNHERQSALLIREPIRLGAGRKRRPSGGAERSEPPLAAGHQPAAARRADDRARRIPQRRAWSFISLIPWCVLALIGVLFLSKTRDSDRLDSEVRSEAGQRDSEIEMLGTEGVDAGASIIFLIYLCI